MTATSSAVAARMQRPLADIDRTTTWLFYDRHIICSCSKNVETTIDCTTMWLFYDRHIIEAVAQNCVETSGDNDLKQPLDFSVTATLSTVAQDSRDTWCQQLETTTRHFCLCHFINSRARLKTPDVNSSKQPRGFSMTATSSAVAQDFRDT
jgi:hypothetical protein